MAGQNWHLRAWATEDSDIHGIKHILRRKGGFLRKGIWLVCFLTATGYFAYLAYNAFITFFQYPHITKLDIKFVGTVEFPAVTVCNFNKYRQSALTEHDIKNVGFHLGIIDEEHNIINPHLYTNDFIERMNSINWSDIENDDNFNMTEFQLRTGHQFKDIIIKCTWKEMPCHEDDFTAIITHFGNCYTFNDWTHNKKRHLSGTAGSSNGLKLIIDVQEGQYTPTNDLDGDGIDTGIKTMLHHPTEPPYIKELGFSTGPGDHSFISMRHEKIMSLDYPYTECETVGDIEYYDHYSLQACRIECETKVVVEECGCKLVEQPSDAPVCNPERSHLCAYPLLVELIDGTSGHDCKCRNPCRVEQYPITTSTARLRSAFIERKFHNTEHNMTEEYIRINVAGISIYYEALNYQTVVQQPAMDIYSLLATIGGNMGLFMGASLLSFIQIMEFFVDDALLCLGCLKTDKTAASTSNGKLPNKSKPMEVVTNGKDNVNSLSAISTTLHRW